MTLTSEVILKVTWYFIHSKHKTYPLRCLSFSLKLVLLVSNLFLKSTPWKLLGLFLLSVFRNLLLFILKLLCLYLRITSKFPLLLLFPSINNGNTYWWVYYVSSLPSFLPGPRNIYCTQLPVKVNLGDIKKLTTRWAVYKHCPVFLAVCCYSIYPFVSEFSPVYTNIVKSEYNF